MPAEPDVREADATQIASYFATLDRRVLTFLGYSDSGYEDPRAMLDIAARVLEEHEPRSTLVNIGATPGGIGAVYEIARQRGFMTSGIVSTQARQNEVSLSPFVDVVFFVADSSWGGLIQDSKTLSPTSQAIVHCSDVVVAIGGGPVARDEFEAARDAGKPARFFAADMNHAAARAAAARKGLPTPTDFRGAAAAAFDVP